jgi:predicted transcriptional regulator
MPKRISLLLDDALAARLDEFVRDRGGDEGAALDLALRAFLDAEEACAAARQTVIAAAKEGEIPIPPRYHDLIRRWLLSWGSEAEIKRAGSC